MTRLLSILAAAMLLAAAAKGETNSCVLYNGETSVRVELICTSTNHPINNPVVWRVETNCYDDYAIGAVRYESCSVYSNAYASVYYGGKKTEVLVEQKPLAWIERSYFIDEVRRYLSESTSLFCSVEGFMQTNSYIRWK